MSSEVAAWAAIGLFVGLGLGHKFTWLDILLRLRRHESDGKTLAEALNIEQGNQEDKS